MSQKFHGNKFHQNHNQNATIIMSQKIHGHKFHQNHNHNAIYIYTKNNCKQITQYPELYTRQ